MHLVRERHILDSPSYLKEKGRPVIALWGERLRIVLLHRLADWRPYQGFGLGDRHHSVEMVRNIARFLRTQTPGGAYLMAGVAAHWRTAGGDADRNPEFANVSLDPAAPRLSPDVISFVVALPPRV
jgi:hypothetical protein